MKLKAKNIPISTGNKNVVLIDAHDAAKYDLHPSDRIKVKYNGRALIAAIDVEVSGGTLHPGKVGLFFEVSKVLQVPMGQQVSISLENKPVSTKYIKLKLSGRELSKNEIHTIIKDIVDGALTDIELTYFVAGCFSHGLTTREVTAMIHAIVNTGTRLKVGEGPIMDKHCIGGVPNNRTTLIVTPIVAAFGLKMPKTSSRAITSPAGTADTMEVFAKVDLPIKQMKRVISKTNACMVWGGAVNLAPADDKIIRVEHPLYIDTTGLLLSSVLAKKYSVGATHLLIDIPYGPGAKIKTKKRAEHLKKQFQLSCRKLGMKVKVILTDGRQPIGNGMGPLLEALDVLKVLKDEKDAPQDLKEKSISMAGELINLSGKTKNGQVIAREILESGLAYEKMKDIIQAQGKKRIPKLARYKALMRAKKRGKVKEIHNSRVTKLARLCGAPKAKEAGLYIHAKVGDIVEKGAVLITLYANNKELLRYAKEYYEHSLPFVIK